LCAIATGAAIGLSGGISAAWLTAVMLAVDLLAWAQNSDRPTHNDYA
jgi:hypothetical protein